MKVSSFAGNKLSAKMKETSDKAINSPQVIKEKKFLSICLWKASALFSRKTFYDEALGSALFLIFQA